MKYVLFATPRFGRIVLETLCDAGFPPVALVCNPDAPIGRKKIVTAPETKQLVEERDLNIPVFQPNKVKDIYEDLRALNADVFIVASYGKILKKELLEIPEKGVLGVHGSVLPAYRGASPMQQVLIDGKKETGISLFIVGEKVDDGPVIAEAFCTIPENMMYLELEKKLAIIGGQLCVDAIPDYLADELEPQEQDHEAATFTTKFSSKDGFISLADLKEAMQGNKTKAKKIHNRIRGLTPRPGVWTEIEGKRIKLLESRVRKDGLEVTAYQKAGKKKVTEILEI